MLVLGIVGSTLIAHIPGMSCSSSFFCLIFNFQVLEYFQLLKLIKKNKTLAMQGLAKSEEDKISSHLGFT